MRAGLVILPLLGILAGCSGKTAEPPAEPLSVATAIVSGATEPATITGVGSIAARRELELGFTTAGQIVTMAVNEGDRVAKGQLLAALDSDQVSSALAAAEAEERRASAEYSRALSLRDDGWVTATRVENARATLDSAAATVRARRFAAQTARIHAPSAGLVLARLAEPREVVAAGSPVVILGEEAGGHVLRLPLSDRESARLSLGAPAQVRLEAQGQTLTGRVIEIGGRSDRATGAFQVEIGLPNVPGLRSGLIGRATIQATPNGLSDGSAGLMLPSGALYSARAGEGFVFVVDASKTARLRKVRLGETDDEGTMALSGIKAGERVAISGLDRLQDGMRVNPTGSPR